MTTADDFVHAVATKPETRPETAPAGLWYGLIALLGLWAGSILAFGLPGLVLPALVLVPVVWALLIVVSRG